MISSVPLVVIVIAHLNAVNADLVKGVLLGAMIAKKPNNGKMILMPIEVQSNGGNGEESSGQENQSENGYNNGGQTEQMGYNGINNNRQQGMKDPSMMMMMPIMNKVHKPNKQMMNNNMNSNSMYGQMNGQMNGQKSDNSMYSQMTGGKCDNSMCGQMNGEMNGHMNGHSKNRPPVYRERNQQNGQSYNQQQMNQYEGNEEQNFDMMNSFYDDEQTLANDRSPSIEQNNFDKKILTNKNKNRHLYKNGKNGNKLAKQSWFNGQNPRIMNKMDNFYHI